MSDLNLHALTKPVNTEGIETSRFLYKNAPIRFAIDNPKDVIQNCQFNGYFYEQGELEDVSLVIPTGAVIYDIGANVGNHTVYFGKFCRAAKILTFEPNPRAINLLRKNIELNSLGRVVDLSQVGVGIGKIRQQACFFEDDQKALSNLGAATLNVEGESSTGLSIDIHPLDNLTLSAPPDLLKIDVEGMEMDVLEGALQTIRTHRPVIYIEVSARHRIALKQFMMTENYRIERTHQHHRNVVNFLCTPW